MANYRSDSTSEVQKLLIKCTKDKSKMELSLCSYTPRGKRHGAREDGIYLVSQAIIKAIFIAPGPISALWKG